MLFAALNAMGYNYENNSKGMSSARKKTRTALKRHDWRGRLPTLSRAIERHHPWFLIHALFVKPSKLSRSSASDFQKFSKDQLIQKLWKSLKTDITKENKGLFPLFKKETIKIIEFLKISPSVRKIILIANPLDAYWRGYSFKIKSTGYIVVGPGAKKNNGETMRHELLHLLAPTFRLPRKLTVSRALPAATGYTGCRIINRECVIRALNILYQKQVLHSNISPALKREEKHFPRIEKCVISLKEKMKRSYPSK